MLKKQGEVSIYFDNIAPEIVQYSFSDTTTKSVKVNVIYNEDATLYYAGLQAGDYVPSEVQIIEGTGFLCNGQVNIEANNQSVIYLQNLTGHDMT